MPLEHSRMILTAVAIYSSDHLLCVKKLIWKIPLWNLFFHMGFHAEFHYCFPHSYVIAFVQKCGIVLRRKSLDFKSRRKSDTGRRRRESMPWRKYPCNGLDVSEYQLPRVQPLSSQVASSNTSNSRNLC